MMYPVRISKNGKGGLRFTLPRELKVTNDWDHNDIYIAYPKDERYLLVKHFHPTDKNIAVPVEEKYKGLVYSFYVIKGRTQMLIEIPNKLCQFFNWLNDRLLVIDYSDAHTFTIRSITQL